MSSGQGQRGAISIGGGRCTMRLRRFGKHRETKIADQSKAMGWQDLTHSDENAKYRCYRFARLVSDDTGQELGLVMQFYEWGPAYALLDDCRLGPHDTFEEAQAAVEDPKKAKPLPYFSTSKLDDVYRPADRTSGHAKGSAGLFPVASSWRTLAPRSLARRLELWCAAAPEW